MEEIIINRKLTKLIFDISLITTTFFQVGSAYSGISTIPLSKDQMDQVLVRAVEENNAKGVERMLLEGADPSQIIKNVKTDCYSMDGSGGNPYFEENFTLLQYSVRNCYLQIATLLINDNRTNLDEIANAECSICGRPPLAQVVISLRNKESMYLFKLLLGRGANTNVSFWLCCSLDEYLERYDDCPVILKEARDALVKARFLCLAAFAQAFHPRLGRESPARVLPRELYQRICGQLLRGQMF